MSFTAQRLTAAVQKHDRELYVIQPKIGGLCLVMRRARKLVAYAFNGGTLWVSEPNDFQVLPLTHNWQAKGRPVEWGVLPLMERLRSMDAHNDSHDGGVIARLEREDEKHEEAKRRHVRSLHEAMAYEQHSVFRKAFKDINTANLRKDLATKGMKRNGYL